MSDLDYPKMLNRKTNRSKKSKSILQKTKNKNTSRKIHLRKNSKKKARQIKIYKQKTIKKLISYKNSSPKNINTKNNSEKAFINEENDTKKDDCCQENSLGQLTKNFLNYIKTKDKKSININDLVNELDVKKRRIYDITNVLQGMGYLQKSGKNEIVWTKQLLNKTKNKKMKNNNINNINIQRTKINNLEKEKNKLEKDINIFKDEFNSISKKNDFSKYGYITMDDLKSFSNENNIDLLIIKTTKGTVMNILDNKDIKNAYNRAYQLMENGEMKKNEILLNILKKNNQLMLNCPGEGRLNFYYVKNGELKEIGKNDNNNRNNNNIGNTENNFLIPKYVNNNFNVNNLIENNNYNVAINYNLNINKDNSAQNNMYNNYNNPINNNNSFFNKNSFVNYNKIENNCIFPRNIIIKNEQKNIGVYASFYNKNNSMKNILNFNSNYDVNLLNFKNQMKVNNNKDNINYKYKNKLVEEKFSISTNSFNENKVLN